MNVFLLLFSVGKAFLSRMAAVQVRMKYFKSVLFKYSGLNLLFFSFHVYVFTGV